MGFRFDAPSRRDRHQETLPDCRRLNSAILHLSQMHLHQLDGASDWQSIQRRYRINR
jgi:hypothetical protein